MSFHHSPKIVTDGLLMYLDAANIKSFPKSGSTWYDLSGNGYHATIKEDENIGGALVDGMDWWVSDYGGIFDFPTGSTTDCIALDGVAAQQTTTQYTLEFWVRWYNTSGKYFCDMSDGGNHNLVLNAQNALSIAPNGVSAISYADGEVMQTGWIRDTDGGTSAGIKNGVRTTATTPPAITTCHADGWILNQEQDSLGGTFATQACWAGWCIVKLYNRALTDIELKQNYDATKGRFGL